MKDEKNIKVWWDAALLQLIIYRPSLEFYHLLKFTNIESLKLMVINTDDPDVITAQGNMLDKVLSSKFKIEDFDSETIKTFKLYLN